MLQSNGDLNWPASAARLSRGILFCDKVVSLGLPSHEVEVKEAEGATPTLLISQHPKSVPFIMSEKDALEKSKKAKENKCWKA